MVLETNSQSTQSLDSDCVDSKEGARILDRQARRYLNMSGEEFARAYKAGEIPEPDRSEVIRVAILLPFIGESSIAGKDRQVAIADTTPSAQ